MRTSTYQLWRIANALLSPMGLSLWLVQNTVDQEGDGWAYHQRLGRPHFRIGRAWR